MYLKRNYFIGVASYIAVIIMFLYANNVYSFKAKTNMNSIEALEFMSKELYISQTQVPIEKVINQLPNSKEWNNFLPAHGTGYVYIDPRSGRPVSLTQVFPLIPGTGQSNTITFEELSLKLGYKVEKLSNDVVKDAALQFISAHTDILNINTTELGEVKITNTNRDYLWDIFITRTINNIPVRDANISLSINHGNVSLWGVEKWGDVNLSLIPTINNTQAMASGFNYIGGRTALDKMVQEPKLEIVLIAPEWDGTVGKGYDHALVWSFVFQREGFINTWEMLVDAYTGKLLSFRDLNAYVTKKIVGTVYPVSNDNCSPQGVAQTGVPMPYTNTGFASPNDFTNNGGRYDYTSGTATTTLNGRYVNVVDVCGNINENSSSGNIDLGGNNGDHDCTTPSGHSLGDTMAARACTSEIPQLNNIAWGWVNYSWLNTSLPCYVNIHSTCNASGSGSSINFFQSGGGCSNAGEIAAVLSHEWGHGLDDSDTNGTWTSPVEAYADINAIAAIHNSCLGEGWYVTNNQGCGQWTCPSSGLLNGYNCDGYGDCCTSCTGIRDSNFARHTSGNPHTISNFVCTSCTQGGTWIGPCGREAHCEGYATIEMAWDLVTRDLAGSPFFIDRQTAFEILARLFYTGSGVITDWYSCTCPNTSSACGANNGYMRWLNADDDDGNINNGTPHMTALYAAFNRHSIACDTPAAINSGCAGIPTSAPSLTANSQDNAVSLSWTLVPGAAGYYVFRTEGPMGCDYGKAKIAVVGSGSYTDTDVGNQRTYNYAVAAVAANNTCMGPLSNCAAVTPCGIPQFSGVQSVTDTDGCYAGGIQITWQVPGSWGEGASSGTYSVRRYIGADCWGSYSVVASDLPANQTSFIDNSTTTGTTYYYQVLAKNDCPGAQPTSGTASCSLSITDHVAEIPSGLANIMAADLNGCTDTGVLITWQADASNWGDGGTGTRHYDVYRGATIIASNLSYGTTSFIDTGGINGTNYVYYVQYVNGCNYANSPPGAQAMDHIADWPSGLANITASDINGCADTGVLITWQADASNWGDAGTGTRHYNVYRGATIIASNLSYGTTSFIDASGTNGTNYDYFVQYVNGCNYVTFSSGAQAMDHVVDWPSGLASITASDINGCADSGVLITWQADAGDWGDGGTGTRHYNIYRGATIIAPNLSYGTTSFIDTSGTNDTNYTYFVQYINGCNYANSPPGAQAMDHVADVPSGLANITASDINGCADTGVLITWQADAGDWGDGGTGIRHYNVYRGAAIIASNLSYGTTSFIDTGGTNGTNYTYFVQYVNGCNYGNSPPGAQAMDHVGDSPSGLTNNTAADLNACLDTGILVAWTADPADWGDGGTGTRTYYVLRDGNPIAQNVSYGTTSFIDTTGINSTSYLYTVVYQNGCGILSFTNPGTYAADIIDTIPCPDIGNTLRVTKSGSNALISWSAVTCSDLAFYSVYGTAYYSAPFPASWTLLGNPLITSLSDPLVSNNIGYKTISVDLCGNWGGSHPDINP